MLVLRNQVALVTGASSGIGKAIALRLAGEGVNLCLVGRRIEALAAVAEKARMTSVNALNYKVNLEVDQEVHEFCSRLLQDVEHIDIVVHSAGTISLGRIDETRIQDFDTQYHVNVRAPWLLTQALLPGLRARKGQIVFINSSAGLNARAGVGQYAATKHSLKALADSLRQEVNPDGVRVLSIFPGRTATPLQAAVCKEEDKPYHPDDLLQPKDVADMLIAALTLPRTAEVTDINIRPLKNPRIGS